MAQQTTLERVQESWKEHKMIPDDIDRGKLLEVYDALAYDEEADRELLLMLDWILH